MAPVFPSASPYLRSDYYVTIMDFRVKTEIHLMPVAAPLLWNGWIHKTIATLRRHCAGRSIRRLRLENWLMCTASKDKRRVKMIVKKEQVQNEMSCIARLRISLFGLAF
jgi:hypothetical protein